MRAARNVLITVIFLLVFLGALMLCSTSIEYATIKFNDPYHFVKRHCIWLGISAVATLFTVFVFKYEWLKKCSYILWSIVIFLLVLVRIPGIGSPRNGSWRWMEIGPFTFQPSEFAKLSLIILLAYWYDKNRRKCDTFKRGFLYPGMFFGVTVLLILIEPDIGTGLLTGSVGILMMIIAGVPFIKFLLPSVILGVTGIGIFVMNNAERFGRIMAFSDVGAHLRDDGWQLANSLEAISRGGFWGVGLGESMQKRFRLPEAHTDFVLAIIAEELGLLGSCGVVILFFAMFVSGVIIGMKTSDMFGRYIVLGIVFMISFQSLINICVVAGSLPTKGLALPFLSYGGSSFLINAIMISLVINIANKELRISKRRAMELH